MKNLRGIDLNLMTVFEAIYEEGSQAAAAKRLHMTQPAVSSALSRLRLMTKNVLFETTSRGAIPSSVADALYIQVHQALMLIRNGLAEHDEFDPLKSQRKFTLSMGYGGGALFGLPLYQHLRKVAPQVKVAIRAVDPIDDIPRLLAENLIDFVLHHAPFDDVMLDQTLMTETELVVIASKYHPRIHEQSTIEELLGESFVAVYQYDIHSRVKEFRDFRQAYKARIALEVPNAIMFPPIVNSTELLAVTTRRMAGFFGDKMDIVVIPLDIKGACGEIYFIWHRSMQSDPAHQWLREQVDTTFKKVMKSLS